MYIAICCSVYIIATAEQLCRIIKFIIDFLQQISSTLNHLVCTLCPTLPHLPLGYDVKGYLKHIKLFHAHQSGFKLTCSIGGCKRSFTNFRTFQDHVSAAHKYQNQLVNITNTDTSAADVCNGDYDHEHHDLASLENPDCSSSSSSSSDSGPFMMTDLMETSCKQNVTPNPIEVLQKSSALFMLGLKEKHRLPQAVLQQILDGVTILTQTRLSVLQLEVYIYIYIYIHIHTYNIYTRACMYVCGI